MPAEERQTHRNLQVGSFFSHKFKRSLPNTYSIISRILWKIWWIFFLDLDKTFCSPLQTVFLTTTPRRKEKKRFLHQVYFMERAKAAGVKEQKEEEEVSAKLTTCEFSCWLPLVARFWLAIFVKG